MKKYFYYPMIALLSIVCVTTFTSCGGSDDDDIDTPDVTGSIDVIRPLTDWNATKEEVKAWGDRNALTPVPDGGVGTAEYVAFMKDGGFPMVEYMWDNGKIFSVTVQYVGMPSKEASQDLVKRTAKMLGVTFKPFDDEMDGGSSVYKEMGEAQFRGDRGLCYVTYMIVNIQGGWAVHFSYSPEGY